MRHGNVVAEDFEVRRVMERIGLVLLMVMIATACVHRKRGKRQPTPQPTPAVAGSNQNSAVSNATSGKPLADKVPTTTTPSAPDPCMIPKVSLPASLGVVPAVATRFIKTCLTAAGETGVLQDTAWTAMGIPCSAGRGKVDVTGTNYLAPKMLAFPIATDCPMEPLNLNDISAAGRETLGLGPTSKVLAFNPFAVQFWELPGFTDTDVGFTIEFRSAAALEGGWSKLRENNPIRLNLYGRENAWVQGDNLYFVEADLLLTDKHAFKLKPVSIRPITVEEQTAVRGRCEKIRPRRNCSQIF
jgi:hypothetical protein